MLDKNETKAIVVILTMITQVFATYPNNGTLPSFADAFLSRNTNGISASMPEDANSQTVTPMALENTPDYFNSNPIYHTYPNYTNYIHESRANPNMFLNQHARCYYRCECFLSEMVNFCHHCGTPVQHFVPHNYATTRYNHPEWYDYQPPAQSFSRMDVIVSNRAASMPNESNNLLIEIRCNDKCTAAKQYLEKISNYMANIVENCTDIGQNGIMSICNTVKEVFISKEKLGESHYIQEDIISTNLCFITIRPFWTNDALVVLNDYIKRQTTLNSGFLFNWVANTTREMYDFNENEVNQWEKRYEIAKQYFNMPPDYKSIKNPIARFKLSMYYMFTIIGSDSLTNRALKRLKSAGRDESLKLPPQLNALASHYFMNPFFEMLDFITQLGNDIHNNYKKQFFKILEIVDINVHNVFKRTLIPSNGNEEHQINIFLGPRATQSGIFNTTCFNNIIKDIESLKDNWVREIEILNKMEITPESYIITVFLGLLKEVIVVSRDVGIAETVKQCDVNYFSEKSRMAIFEYLVMSSFDMMKVKHLVSRLLRNEVQFQQ